MAVDFSLMPSEAPLPENAPSPFIWSLVFVMLAVAGIAIALWTWPHQASTGNARFWFQVVVLPVCGSGALIVRRFVNFHHRRNRMRAGNLASRAYCELVYEAASEPLAVLGFDFRVDADPTKNSIDAFRKRSANPPTRIGRISGETIVASYLEPKEAALTFDDRERQVGLLNWILGEFIGAVAPVIERVPSDITFDVHLDAVSTVLTRDDVLSIWARLPDTVLPPQLRVEPTIAPGRGLWAIDSMLDRTEPSALTALTLLINCNLSALYAEDPVPGSTESASMLLLCSPLFAKQHGLPTKAFLHRPQSSSKAPDADPVHYGLKWAKATGDAISGLVLGGLDEDASTKIRRALGAEGWRQNSGSSTLQLESLVGHTGPSTPWIATSMALALASSGNALYAVCVPDGEDTLFVVVAPPEHHDPESDSET